MFFRSSPIGNAIIAATQEGNMVDVSANMEIVDMVSQAETGAVDASLAIRKRLTSKVKSVELLSLRLLEMLVKNCGHRFHVQIAKKEFMDAVRKMVVPRGTGFYKDELLTQIQSWADAFGRGKPEFASLYQTYDELLREGVEFPDTDLDALAPIHTPKQTHEIKPRKESGTERDLELAMQLQEEEDARMPPYVPPSGRVEITDQEAAKLRSDFKRVRASIKFVADSAESVDQGVAGAEFAKEEHAALVSMQERLAVLLSHVENSDFTVEMLALNDEINVLLEKCERFTSVNNTSTVDNSEPTANEMGGDNVDHMNADLIGLDLGPPLEPAPLGAPAANPFNVPPSTSSGGWPVTVDTDPIDVFSNQAAASEQGPSLVSQMMGMNTRDAPVNFGADSPLPDFDEQPEPEPSSGTGTALSNADFELFLSEKAQHGAAQQTTIKTTEQERRERAVDDIFGL